MSPGEHKPPEQEAWPDARALQRTQSSRRSTQSNFANRQGDHPASVLQHLIHGLTWTAPKRTFNMQGQVDIDHKHKWTIEVLFEGSGIHAPHKLMGDKLRSLNGGLEPCLLHSDQTSLGDKRKNRSVRHMAA